MLRKIAHAIEKIWATYPFIGIVLLFAAIGFTIFIGLKSREAAHAGSLSSQHTYDLVQGELKSKDAIIAEKDGEINQRDILIAQKDNAINTQTSIIGQIYNAAIALQQQITLLHGQPKSIPITIPNSNISSPTAISSTPNTSKLPTPMPSSSCNLGLNVAPVNAVQLQICIPPKR